VQMLKEDREMKNKNSNWVLKQSIKIKEKGKTPHNWTREINDYDKK
jgi:hypothetical protein